MLGEGGVLEIIGFDAEVGGDVSRIISSHFICSEETLPSPAALPREGGGEFSHVLKLA